MTILVPERDVPVLVGEFPLEFVQAITNRSCVLITDEPGFGQHLGVGDRAPDVVRHEPCIEPVILARGIAQDALVQRQPFLPEAGHDSSPCSAGVSAAMSLTTRVPVPSFVNTSSNRLSGTLYEMT